MGNMAFYLVAQFRVVCIMYISIRHMNNVVIGDVMLTSLANPTEEEVRIPVTADPIVRLHQISFRHFTLITGCVNLIGTVTGQVETFRLEFKESASELNFVSVL